MNRIGIWLDHKCAKIVNVDGPGESMVTLKADIDTSKAKGGSRSKDPYGPVITVSEKKHQAKKEQQVKAFFDQIADFVKDAESIAVFGPGELKSHFKNFLLDDSSLKSKFTGIEAADSMTDNQVVAMVREYYANH